MYSFLSGFSQSPQTILHSFHSQKLFSLTIFFLGAVLLLIPLFPIPTPYQQSDPQRYLVLSCVCFNSPSFTDIIVDFLHTPLPSPLTFSLTLKPALLPPAVFHPHQSLLLSVCGSSLMKIFSAGYQPQIWSPSSWSCTFLLAMYALLTPFDIYTILGDQYVPFILC